MTALRSTDGTRPMVAVTQIELPAEAWARCTLSRVDYTDAFRVEAGIDLTPDRWIHAMLRDAPWTMRASLVTGWTALGFRLRPPWARDQVLGWATERLDSDTLLLSSGARFGLEGQLLVHSTPGGLLFATFVQQRNAGARAAWAAITPRHQRVVRSLLIHAARREVDRSALTAGPRGRNGSAGSATPTADGSCAHRAAREPRRRRTRGNPSAGG